MDSAPPVPSNTSSEQPSDPNSSRTVAELPPEAIALAGRLFDAARSGQMDIFEQALGRGLSANLTNEKGDTLLMLAAYHNHPSLVSLLLSHSADPNRLNDRGQSIMAGAVFKLADEVVEILLNGVSPPPPLPFLPLILNHGKDS
ncbi:MAG: hypothetical protein Q9227_000657 [Pyrenula ochraceoflavens]